MKLYEHDNRKMILRCNILAIINLFLKGHTIYVQSIDAEDRFLT